MANKENDQEHNVMQSLQAKAQESDANSNSSDGVEIKAFTLVVISTMAATEKQFKSWQTT